jgi:uncharacterized protein YqjF (DUF2071 family)
MLTQTWRDLCFLHWPVEPAALRPFVPDGLALETAEGSAWLGAAAFVMEDTRVLGAPLPFGIGDLPELNLRTYVRAGGRPGVWFHSLDAGAWTAVRVGRRGWRLPYHRARMRVERRDGRIHFESHRAERHSAPVAFRGTYAPVGPPTPPRRGTLEHFLTERYCLYAVDRRGRPLRTEIHHAPWPLQPARARVERNTLAEPLGIALPAQPTLAHYARRLAVRIWSPERA